MIVYPPAHVLRTRRMLYAEPLSRPRHVCLARTVSATKEEVGYFLFRLTDVDRGSGRNKRVTKHTNCTTLSKSLEWLDLVSSSDCYLES